MILANLHKYLGAKLCSIGRHDYETDSVDPRGRFARLECFYCGQGKISYCISRGNESIMTNQEEEKPMSIQESITKAAIEGATKAVIDFSQAQIEYYRDRAAKAEADFSVAKSVGLQLQNALNDIGNLVGIEPGTSLLTEVRVLVEGHMRELQRLRMEASIAEELKKAPPPDYGAGVTESDPPNEKEHPYIQPVSVVDAIK